MDQSPIALKQHGKLEIVIELDEISISTKGDARTVPVSVSLYIGHGN